ncbi:hypothetical protein AB0A63_29075 [Lentzea sp. NPDC042327]|uniref:hypothetical protein n=1 Tax=Lentzea sp. NPDC042327 TaxID=3154801 RepID=UPI0033DACA2B
MPAPVAANQFSKFIAPYITTWSAEQEIPSRVVERPGYGVGYADELLGDRDSHGVLWQRAAVRHGVGRPEFGKVHPLRQRRAMRKLLCQVCAGPAGQDEDGVLWLLRDYQEDWAGWPEGMACTEPPVCVPCAALSLRLCPALRRGAVAVRVRSFEVAGIRGALYRKGVFGPVAVEDVNLAYNDPDSRWVVASALIRELRDCTFVPLTELTEQHDAVQTR